MGVLGVPRNTSVSQWSPGWRMPDKMFLAEGLDKVKPLAGMRIDQTFTSQLRDDAFFQLIFDNRDVKNLLTLAEK